MDGIGALIIAYATKIGGVIVLFFLMFYMAKKIREGLQTALTRTDRIDVTLGRFISTTAYWGFIVLASLAILSYFGVQTTGFAAVIGGASLAIGLAFQGTLSNLAAGVMLLVFRPFKVGDVIRVAGEVGGVEELGLFTTQLKTLDNRLIIIPNSSVFGSTIENMTASPERRVDLQVSTPNAADLNAVRALLVEAAAGVSGIINNETRANQVYLLNTDGGAANWEVRVWCKTADFWTVRETLNTELKLKLDEAGMRLVRPFKAGEGVIIAGQKGVVEEMGLFGVRLRTPDNRVLTVPNGAFAGSVIENITGRPQRRVDINVGTDYGADLKQVRAVLEKAAASVSGALKTEAHPNQVFLSDLGDSSINWQVRVWCNTPEYWAVWQETTQAVKMHLDEAGIGIPFPQMDVHHAPL